MGGGARRPTAATQRPLTCQSLFDRHPARTICETQRLVFMTIASATILRCLGRFRRLGLAMLLVICVLAGTAADVVATHPTESSATAVVALAGTSLHVVVPVAPALPRSLVQPRLAFVALSVLLGLGCWLCAQALQSAWRRGPPRARPGRRGRTVLDAFLN
jgi:hypothetical protein